MHCGLGLVADLFAEHVDLFSLDPFGMGLLLKGFLGDEVTNLFI